MWVTHWYSYSKSFEKRLTSGFEPPKVKICQSTRISEIVPAKVFDRFESSKVVELIYLDDPPSLVIIGSL